MKCKFEHDEDCCNSGSLQYMCKCKPNVCGACVPMSHGDVFRTQTNEELANFLSIFVSAINCPKEVWELYEKGLRYEDAWLNWLNRPCE